MRDDIDIGQRAHNYTMKLDKLGIHVAELWDQETLEAMAPDVAANVRCEVAWDIRRQALLMQLQTYVLTMGQKTEQVRYPKTWVQAVKQRFAPYWFRRRFPVVNEVVEVTVFEKVFQSVYPDRATSFRDSTLQLRERDDYKFEDSP